MISMVIYFPADFDENSISVALVAVSSTSATISWALGVPPLTATSYSLSYSNSGHTDCFTDPENITEIPGSLTQPTLTLLHAGTQYSVVLTALLSNGEMVQKDFDFETEEIGKHCDNMLHVCCNIVAIVV